MPSPESRASKSRLVPDWTILHPLDDQFTAATVLEQICTDLGGENCDFSLIRVAKSPKLGQRRDPAPGLANFV